MARKRKNIARAVIMVALLTLGVGFWLAGKGTPEMPSHPVKTDPSTGIQNNSPAGVTSLVATASTTNAQSPHPTVRSTNSVPAIDELIANVSQAMIPVRPYRANVEQVTSMAANTVTNAIARQTTTQTFSVVFDAAREKFVPETPVRAQKKPANHVTSNIVPFLKTLRVWPDVEITQADISGRRLIKLKADSGRGLSSMLLIDAEDYFVPTAQLFINGKKFADTTFHYRNEAGVWVPDRIVIDYVADGSRVTQVYQP